MERTIMMEHAGATVTPLQSSQAEDDTASHQASDDTYTSQASASAEPPATAEQPDSARSAETAASGRSSSPRVAMERRIMAEHADLLSPRSARVLDSQLAVDGKGLAGPITTAEGTHADGDTKLPASEIDQLDPHTREKKSGEVRHQIVVAVVACI